MPDEIPDIPRYRGKRNRPTDTRWHQQKLAAFRPTLTIRAVTPFMIVLGIVILCLGIWFYFAASASHEIKIDYTNCADGDDIESEGHFAWPDGMKQCSIPIEVAQTFKNKVKFYYALDRFYQNYRMYLSSRDDLQLVKLDSKVSKDCKPYDYVNQTDSFGNETRLPIAPCGAIANSMFNDSFALFYLVNDTQTVRVPFTALNIISDLEQKRKFKNPNGITDNVTELCEALEDTAMPLSWQKPLCELGAPTEDGIDEQVGLGFQNVDLMVWMKPAALPNFRKMYRFLDPDKDEIFKDGLPEGSYKLLINYNYPVASFKGKKYFIISHETWFGPQNFFLPVIYMVTGAFLIMAFVLLFVCDICRQRYFKQDSEDILDKLDRT